MKMTKEEVLAEIANRAEMEVSPDTKVEELPFDSLELLDLLVGFDINQDQLPTLHTVGDILAAAA